MKQVLTEKDINIFTIVKDKNNISPLRQWCIDSWHKCMPEANIMIFDDKDLTNPNWKYYDVIKNDKLWNWYLHFNNTAISKNMESINPISTDSIRIRLLRAIPNALYMDSDAYLNITSKEFLELCNKYYETDILFNSAFSTPTPEGNKISFAYTGYFAGAKNTLLDDAIACYDKVAEETCSQRIMDLTITPKYYDPKKHNVKLFLEWNKNLYHFGISMLNYTDDMICINRDIDVIIVKKFDKIKDVLKHSSYDDILRIINRFIKDTEKQYFFILDGNFTLITGINFSSASNHVYKHILKNTYLTRIYNIVDVNDNQYIEFISVLKKTVNGYFKQVLDKGKTIDYYELEDLGDDPNTPLKKL